MARSRITTLSGYILASTLQSRVQIQPLLEWREKDAAKFVSQGFYRSVKSWHNLHLHTRFPILPTDDSSGAIVSHPVIVIPGWAKMVVLAERREVAEFVRSRVLSTTYEKQFVPVPFNLPKLVEHCSAADSEYLVTSLIGRRASSSTDLRTISLYGDEITDSVIFKDLAHHFNFFICGLGPRNVDQDPLTPHSEKEILRIGNDGFVTANIANGARARSFNSLVDYLFRPEWVPDWVPLKPPATK